MTLFSFLAERRGTSVRALTLCTSFAHENASVRVGGNEEERERDRETESLVVVVLVVGVRRKREEEVIFDRKKKKCKQNRVCDWNFGRWENVSL